ncbi:hypothetical protein AJ85_18750 [Alkalihalobacillus alcalophilus ATCC 27647 = CGMCC 1.3604]|uniref:SGNH hydrolase-type esterase domain-containing protein n=1 Tax=Alkalihalobacillus alcalophilus ATCC 27647 = CGMCC 1.3604 TaxID=1218173 RepID=A0A094WG76_ALKAL|nr:SGNH/GDSL hydrolase family protein [Alkalihalobacillus alcalophilus]KGA95771.1 hypothetical protein BALCAV_0220425 [Alkalihalobacillus alcalophilus ATCC 27647 = CGMCC 1.3604]MED1563833.1 SGNH/GDSL hydrolase family protein [Alkalihalobacillus alcalophilus]THG92047.1 hypothetical protein AJ85_18750 [Alkalihalobacillus alcalophilus ATCC 27647 = CGMCC 1.3604]
MKNVLLVLFVVACLALLVVGHFQYEAKLNNIASDAEGQAVSQELTLSTEEGSHDEDSHPERVEGLIRSVLKAHNTDTLSLVYLGSDALGEGEEGSWPHLVNEHLVDLLGEEQVETNLIPVGMAGSTSLLNDTMIESILETEPNLLIIEPLVLNNIRFQNGYDITTTIADIETLIADIQERASNLEIVITPSNPIHSPTSYHLDIEQLQEFATTNDYLYANHWTEWPDYHSDEIKDYLHEGRPNEAGHQVWADYMIDFLTK